MKHILISLSALLLFTACSSKQYFEPEDVSSNIDLNKESMSSSIISMNRIGATLEDGKIINEKGISSFELPEGFDFLNTTADGKIIATNRINKLLIGNEERIMKDVVVAASIKDDKLAVVYSSNTIELIDLKNIVFFYNKISYFIFF